MKHLFDCELCSGRVIGRSYETGSCEACGQSYAYDEGFSISLSEGQKALLREARPRVITRVMDDGVQTKDGAA